MSKDEPKKDKPVKKTEPKAMERSQFDKLLKGALRTPPPKKDKESGN